MADLGRYCPCNAGCHAFSNHPCSIDCFAHHDEILWVDRDDGVTGAFLDSTLIAEFPTESVECDASSEAS